MGGEEEGREVCCLEGRGGSGRCDGEGNREGVGKLREFAVEWEDVGRLS